MHYSPFERLLVATLLGAAAGGGLILILLTGGLIAGVLDELFGWASIGCGAMLGFGVAYVRLDDWRSGR